MQQIDPIFTIEARNYTLARRSSLRTRTAWPKALVALLVRSSLAHAIDCKRVDYISEPIDDSFIQNPLDRFMASSLAG